MARQASEAKRARRRFAWLVSLCLAFLPVAAHGTTYRIATGRYTGDGASLRPITGLGFQPDLVLVKGALGAATRARSSGMPADASKSLGTATALEPNGIVSFAANGFAVGNDVTVNAAATAYYWIAFAASDDVMVVGSYTGDGQDNRHVGTGFQPSYVVVLGEGGQLAMQRFAAQGADLSLPFVDSAERTNCIQGFDTAGFTVGTDASVNAVGTVYHYVAWKAALDIVADGVYSGDASASRDIFTGFQPEYVLVTRRGAGAPAVQRSDSLAVDTALYCDATGGTLTGSIRQFLPTGFRVGAGATTNAGGQTYYYAAFNTATDLLVEKTVDRPAAAEGDTVAYLVSVTNRGPGDLSAIQVDDLLPASLTYLAHTPSQGSYTSSNGRWLLGTLSSGASATLDLRATVDIGVSGVVNNIASSSIFDGSGDIDLSNNATSVGITVQTGDIAIGKSVDDPTPIEGQTVGYTVTVAILGAPTTTGITVTDLLPAGVTYQSHTASHGSYTSGTGVWAVGTLAPSETGTLVISARVGFGTAGSTIENSATLTAANLVDLVPANDVGMASITPVAAPSTDLALTKSVNDLNPDEGDSLSYTVTLTNLGPSPGTGIEVLDLLPQSLDYVSYTASQGAYDAGTGIWSVGTLGLSNSATLTLVSTLDIGARVPVVANVAAIRRADQSDPVTANDTARVDIPTVQTEPLPIGTSNVLPGTPGVPLLTLRLVNQRTEPATLSGLRLGVSAGLTRLQLWRDDGDLVFEPLADALLATGAPGTGSWTASGFVLALAPAETATLFVSADVSLDTARHGLALQASVATAPDLTWSEPVTVATPQGFPLASPGAVTVSDLVRAQIGFVALPADTTDPGASGVPLLQFHIPDDGGTADVLERIDVLQLGDAASGTDLVSVHLQTLAQQNLAGANLPAEDAAPPGRRDAIQGDNTPPERWIDVEVAQFFHTGGERWSASGFELPIPGGGLEVRVVADVAEAAREGRTLRGALPTSGLVFGSGRRGPEDLGWENPDSVIVRATRVLEVSQVSITGPTAPVPRSATRLPVLGLTLEARSATADTLVSLRLLHTSTGPLGPASDPDAQIAGCDLWRDADADGVLDASDPWIAATLPASAGVLHFGATGSLGVGLPSGVPVQLLVTLTPDSLRIRDAESLRVRLAAPNDVVTAGALTVQLPAALETLVPPVVDGQSARGYDVGTVAGGALLAGTHGTVVLELALPANGVDDDVLQAFRLENDGTASAADIEAVQLLADDGDHRVGPADVLVAQLQPKSGRVWDATGLDWPLVATAPRRYLVAIDVSPSPQSGATFRARIPPGGITVGSGNDGPIDRELLGSNPYVFSVPDRITWIAGIANDHVVRPDAERQTVMVLELFNGYTTARSLNALDLLHTGTATAAELRAWTLFADDNENGVVDDTDRTLSTATLADGHIRFGAFTYTLEPQKQQRLLATYSLLLGAARDGSTIDATLESPAAIAYVEPGTATDGAFPLDSPGTDVVDGFVRAQVENHPVASRTLGGSETNVLVLDLVLPGNGWQPDTLRAFRLESAALDSAAVLGPDMQSLWLWQESGTAAGFDPPTDIRLQSAMVQGSQLLFDALEVAVPAGGRRFYVTLDTALMPTAGRRVALRIPVLGVEMSSANDGPIDTIVENLAVHRFSADDLLASVGATPEIVSRGQTIDLTVHARNQGTISFDRVAPRLLAVEPPGLATLLDGPVPSVLALASQAEGDFLYHFTASTTGSVRFTVQVADSTTQSDPVTSAPIVVVEPPSALDASFTSLLPPAVNRGQTVTAFVTELEHPDAPAGTADIQVRALQLVVEDADGNAQAAASVFDRLELRAGGFVHARLDTLPDASSVRLTLAPPVVLNGGESVELSLVATVAAQATSRSVRLRVASATAIAAADANSGQPVAVRASLPWTTASATIFTPSSSIAVTLESTLPAAVNRGQRDVPAGRFLFTLPGAPDESEARIVALAVAWRDTSGAPLPPAALASRVVVRSGSATLLELTNLGTDAALQLPLAIPQLVASGAPQALDLLVDVRNDTSVPGFTLVIPDSPAFTVRDATSGGSVTAVPVPTAFPWLLGPARVESPASDVGVVAVSRTPPSTYPGARNLTVARLSLDRQQDSPGSADVEIRSLTFRALDDRGGELADVLSSARLLASSTTVAATGAPAGNPTLVLALATPLRLAPGATLDLDLEVDLASTVASAWLRFDFEPLALELRDANDTTRVLATTGDLPFATELVRIVAPPLGIAAGPLAEPPANLSRGVSAPVLDLRLLHPGTANEAAIQPQTLALLVRDAQGAPLPASAVAAAAHLQIGNQSIVARLAADSIVASLANVTPLAPGEAHDLNVVLDMLPNPDVADFRLALLASGVDASAGGERLETQPLPGSTLPWLSASVHVQATNTRESLSSYPNPFTPAVHGSCHITFYLDAEAQVSAEIFTLTGDRVRSLLRNAPLAAGLHDNLTWDGRNGVGDLVRNGTYLLRVVVSGAGGGEFMRKVAVKR